MILNHFYRDYSEDSGIAFFSMLPAISSATPADCFLDALKATALASSSRQLTQCGLMVQARSHYGRAIMGLNDALKNPTVGQDDSVMAALLSVRSHRADSWIPRPLATHILEAPWLFYNIDHP
ncbi:uncharacterized protein CCOS01_04900 [Colletotrichum costaricense]|uniref:Uncharacterized protein n=2 Tax=Colletotrichum acutatum species complex TaxID=2707335 RepID=A0AAI9Z4W9_9PEZI|nr:uncharacterized protein CCOS01_04900 [Colletotrichum costaricense]XP_060386428.1 uncharacterized protein CTAM01_02587 [Colletotrichum tamarilloi]KAK1507475.1 hypothetical protein CTAM01_02587 [Colletotrichum tamarilloi]KAK1532917.1 hypothetical protein CCOS01_04900 [Colletotrichum costaricense]